MMGFGCQNEARRCWCGYKPTNVEPKKCPPSLQCVETMGWFCPNCYGRESKTYGWLWVHGTCRKIHHPSSYTGSVGYWFAKLMLHSANSVTVEASLIEAPKRWTAGASQGHQHHCSNCSTSPLKDWGEGTALGSPSDWVLSNRCFDGFCFQFKLYSKKYWKIDFSSFWENLGFGGCSRVLLV